MWTPNKSWQFPFICILVLFAFVLSQQYSSFTIFFTLLKKNNTPRRTRTENRQHRNTAPWGLRYQSCAHLVDERKGYKREQIGQQRCQDKTVKKGSHRPILGKSYENCDICAQLQTLIKLPSIKLKTVLLSRWTRKAITYPIYAGIYNPNTAEMTRSPPEYIEGAWRYIKGASGVSDKIIAVQ